MGGRARLVFVVARAVTCAAVLDLDLVLELGVELDVADILFLPDMLMVDKAQYWV